MQITPGNVLYASIIASALISGIITLVIEYFAKPRLEIRKDRLLTRAHRRTAFLHKLAELEAWADLLTATGMDDPSKDDPTFPTQFEKARNELNSVDILTTRDARLELPDWAFDRFLGVLAHIMNLGNSIDSVPFGKKYWHDERATVGKLVVFQDYLTCSRLRIFKRRRLRKLLMQIDPIPSR